MVIYFIIKGSKFIFPFIFIHSVRDVFKSCAIVLNYYGLNIPLDETKSIISGILKFKIKLQYCTYKSVTCYDIFGNI